MRVIAFIKREIVLCIAFIAAVISAIFIPPDMGYIDYIDTHVLILLFCLMAVVSGVQRCGLLTKLAHFMCRGEKSLKTIVAALVLLCFFTSMLITNDVALITFVPFAILVLNLIDKKKYIIFTVVMQTIAANLGSMATPVGNPQNLFLYSKFSMTGSEFFTTVLPISLVSLALVILCVLFVKKEKVSVQFDEECIIVEPKKLTVWIILFTLCLLCVFDIINDWVLFGVVCISLIVFERKLFKEVDYSLLATFVFFFIFAGNIARIDSVSGLISVQMTENAKITALLSSQVISNVPAAVMLSNFTNSGTSLLSYTNIGGLGTIIASLASLISFKIYMKTEEAEGFKYLLVFTAFNIGFLVALCILF